MANPSTTPTTPPAKEIRTASMMNWRVLSPPRAPKAPPNADLASALENGSQHDVHDADAADEERDGGDGHHDGIEKLLSALLLGEELRGDDDVKVTGVAMGGIQDAADDFGVGDASIGRGEMQVETIDLILQITLRVFETVEDRIQWREDEVVHVFGADAGNLGLRGKLWRNDSDYMEPLLVEFDVFADRGGRANTTA